METLFRWIHYDNTNTYFSFISGYSSGMYSIYMEINMQYKMLRRGTVILEGDEFLNCDNAWVKTNMLIRVGDEGTAKKYRRPLKSTKKYIKK